MTRVLLLALETCITARDASAYKLLREIMCYNCRERYIRIISAPSFHAYRARLFWLTLTT